MKKLKLLSTVFLFGIIFIFASCEKQEITIQNQKDLIKFIEKNFELTEVDAVQGNSIGDIYSDGKTNIFIVKGENQLKAIPEDDYIAGHLKWRVVEHHLDIYCVPLDFDRIKR